jgi:glycosyltransferase involved in cell wall biosynthesis
MSEAKQLTTKNASVIVCTYNRAASLGRTLEALRHQSVREDMEWEVVVVDNRSTDETNRVIHDFARSFPRIRYAYEAVQGLAHARNRGVSLARGDILLFTDDDVAPECDWLQRVLDDMTATGCDACGGFIAPVWETPPPAWLTERFYGFLAIKAERTDTYHITDESPLPFGANMAFRRHVFARFGGFNTALGRNGSVLASGEDGEFFQRILARGAKVMFFGDARVHHRVESFRLTKRYFRRWRYQTSRNRAERLDFPGERRLFGVPLYLGPQLLRAVARAVFARFSAPADEAFFREIIAWHFLGSIEGLWRRRSRS